MTLLDATPIALDSDGAVESGIDIPRNRVVLYGRDVVQLAQALVAVSLPLYVALRETEQLSSTAAPQ